MYVDIFFLIYIVVYVVCIIASELAFVRHTNDEYPFIDRSDVTIIIPSTGDFSKALKTYNSVSPLGTYCIIVINGKSNGFDYSMLNLVSECIPVDLKNSFPDVKSYYIGDMITVVVKNDSGKACALNLAIMLCRTEYFINIDSDCVMSIDDVMHLIRSVTPDTVAIGANIRVNNPSENFVTCCQWLEYTRTFTFTRVFYNTINAVPLISGACGIYNTEDVRNIGCYCVKTVGEDMNLTLNLHCLLFNNNRNYIGYVNDVNCFTDVPVSFRKLLGQRVRWQKGLFQCLIINRRMILNPRFGVLGLLVLPYLIFYELLSPVINIFGFVWMIISFRSLLKIIIAVLASMAFELINTLIAILVSDDVLSVNLLQMFVSLLLMGIAYEPVVLFARLKGLVDCLKLSEWMKWN